jgi:hypothetical protein
VPKSNTLDTVPFGHKIYFEFIHESDLDNPAPRIYQLWEVKEGERYCILVTNSAGLYRYNLNDLLEIAGWYNQFPLIKFIQKVNGTISLTGEKLHERQFIEAVHATEEHLDVRMKFFVGFADVEKSNYHFYYEPTNQSFTKQDAETFTQKLDAFLQEYNEEYATKRSSNRVKAPDTHLLVSESFEKFKARCIDQGYRDGQFKLNLLMQDEKRREMFDQLVI